MNDQNLDNLEKNMRDALELVSYLSPLLGTRGNMYFAAAYRWAYDRAITETRVWMEAMGIEPLPEEDEKELISKLFT